MPLRTSTPARALLLGLAFFLGGRLAAAQGPTVPNEPTEGAGGASMAGSLLGPAPGDSGTNTGASPAQAGEVLGGRPGTSSPRVPTTATQPDTTGRGQGGA